VVSKPTSRSIMASVAEEGRMAEADDHPVKKNIIVRARCNRHIGEFRARIVAAVAPAGAFVFQQDMPSVDPLRIAAILSEVSAEIILPRFNSLADGEVREKHPGDFVTIADVEAEAALVRRLGDLLAGSRVVGEEAASADATVLGHLEGEGPVWIVDPIDGTSNFVKGRKTFAVIVALVMEGRTLQGWIHDPLSGTTTTAERGAGVWRDGTRLHIDCKGPLSSMSGSVGYRYGRQLADAVHRLVCQGSGAHDYLNLVENRLQFAYFRRLHPWDHAAGVLMHGEAGGYSALLDGQPYRPLPSDRGLLLAPDQEAWQQLRSLIGVPIPR
jgi:fructose-1,6-bisphosphatase/inositol monophosphatase family enzyme